MTNLLILHDANQTAIKKLHWTVMRLFRAPRFPDWFGRLFTLMGHFRKDKSTMSREKKFSSIYWVDGAVMIVPKVAKGMRLWAAPVEYVQFYTPSQNDFDRVEGLKDCLSEEISIESDEGINNRTIDNWPAEIVMFSQRLGYKPNKLERLLVLVSVMHEGDILTFTYTKRARGKLAFRGLPPNTQKKISFDSSVEEIAAAMKPLSDPNT